MISSIFTPQIRQRRQKNLVLELWHEVNTNLERFYVLDQRQFISSRFDLDAWEDARTYSGADLGHELHHYAEVLADFNKAFLDVKNFEEVYSSSIENKTRFNAEILHAKKEVLANKARDIQSCILSAQKALRLMLDKPGFSTRKIRTGEQQSPWGGA